MAFMSSFFCLSFLGLLSIITFHPTTISTTFTNAIRVDILRAASPRLLAFREAPAFRNGDTCSRGRSLTQTGDNIINVVMTLDKNYLRGTVAAVLSILQHSTCPENISFHFISPHQEPETDSSIKSTFPFLNFTIHQFDSRRVRGMISKSIRQALDQPLNYARAYLGDILPKNVERIIYLDSDIIVIDDIAKLWEVNLDDKVVAAPEYCHANFTAYFTNAFWSDKNLAKTFRGRRPCYFNTGVMVVDVARWRAGGCSHEVERWMALQKRKRLYHLGSLPPFLLVLAGKIKPVDHRWNQHGLGGDNFEGKCRGLHPGPVSLLHWSGKGKPWLRLDSRKPCSIDHLWSPYDLYRTSRIALEE